MSTVKNNASASATGFLYQFYVALDRCFDLLENQSIYIETYGDITNNGIEQTEVKHCNRTLTDFDINFWKTLSNWLTLETQNFKSLVLLTTQKIGSNSSIKDWNQSTPEQRVKILKTLRENYKNKKRKNSEIEKFMDNVLKVPETILVEEIGKVSLVTQQPKYKDLYKELCEKHGKCVLKDNRNKFINDLIGYIISQKDASNSGWEITYDNFSNAVRDCVAKYKGISIDFGCIEEKGHQLEFQEDQYNFVNKIKEIEYDEVLSDAIDDYCYTRKLLFDQIKNHRKF